MLNNLEEYRDKILVINMFYVNTNKKHFFKGLSDCQIYFYKIDPEDENWGRSIKQGQWALILKDQPNYSTE